MLNFTDVSLLGFSGSRAPSRASVRALRSVLATLPVGALVVVGCASGIDAVVRAACPGARVFRAAGFGRGALVARSVACVCAVAAASGVWVSFPDTACPSGLRLSSSASACFAGYGSGSWASLALALGLGVRCFVFLPPGVAVPADWPLVPVAAAGWFVSVPGAAQSSLFAK
ncbi:MAG: hypothetical protein JNM09_21975 [Blastocatellia bacterium]|nr:hypothetical protein [Blastocatellia bacterium]